MPDEDIHNWSPWMELERETDRYGDTHVVETQFCRLCGQRRRRVRKVTTNG